MPETATDPIAACVRAELARINKSGRQLAAELSWHYPHLMRRLTGGVPFSASELGRISAHLDVPITRFYGPDSPIEQAS
ncbi:hypothetical protein [Pseudonocardia broussonetiae]|uniref:XRE family transcriptional regulator n=1 Tax=Pseudonocardia broussonetiae TaxID=2736640 RepID=A0A6M6JGU0_9PSEU|nr:hypothetical protein [Pseudonocardia broussonetiae]QJY46696.1 hypothetical protein HOP40_13410 [Pseudonocardia broussonetiae]